jgi:transposase
MNKGNLIGIDLSKHSFQGCLLDQHSDEVFNRKFTRKSLTNWLSRQKPLVVAMEACGSAHHWARLVKRLGHQPLILPTRSVTGFRLGHKTDATDARAIAVAARQPKLKTVAPKTIEQQGMQGVERIRQHFCDHLTATGNLIRGLLNEFGIVLPRGISQFKQGVIEVLEDAENDLPMPLRLQLIESWRYYLDLEGRLKIAIQSRDQLIEQHEACRRLMRLASVGPVNALGLYMSLGDRGDSFANGREASACIGLTPKQNSTGGEVTILGISKKCANKRLRSSLIQGARSVIQVVRKRDPRNSKEAWLKSLIVRRGEGRAAVALANKTIRVAWAMLHYGDDFRSHQTMVV